MQFPAYFLMPDGSVRGFHYPVDFVYEPTDGDGVAYSAQVWGLWSPADWSAACPEWRRLVLIDEPPAVAGDQVLERKGEADWTLDVEALTLAVAYTVAAKPADQLEAEAASWRVAKVQAVNRERDRRLAEGAPYGGRRVEVSDRGRADLGGMVSAAMLANAGLTPWGEGYARGWIAMDNERIPLPTPAAGIQLAATVGDWYGRVMQHARDLKDAAEAGNPADVDELAGWPGAEPAEAAA